MMVSLSPAKMTGSEVDQTTLDGALTFMRPTPLRRCRSGAVLERQPEGIGVPVQVHHHAGQQGSALVVLAEIEVAHLKREVRGNILEPAVLLHRSEEHTPEPQSQSNIGFRLLLEKKNRDGYNSLYCRSRHYCNLY